MLDSLDMTIHFYSSLDTNPWIHPHCTSIGIDTDTNTNIGGTLTLCDVHVEEKSLQYMF